MPLREKDWKESRFFNDEIKGIISEMLTHVENEVSRQKVIDQIRKGLGGDPIPGFILTMIWGFGSNDNRGPSRLSKMLKDLPGVRKILQAAVSALGNNEIEMAHGCFINGIKSTIDRLGISFSSKYLYFAGKALAMEKYPLIFDARVAYSLVALSRPPDEPGISPLRFVSIQPKSNWSSYKTYLEMMYDQAAKLDLEADQIELFLFDYRGPG